MRTKRRIAEMVLGCANAYVDQAAADYSCYCCRKAIRRRDAVIGIELRDGRKIKPCAACGREILSQVIERYQLVIYLSKEDKA